MSDRDPVNVYQQPSSVRCPVCLRVNAADARFCDECGEPLANAHIAPGTVYGPSQTERKLMKDPRWMRVYALLTWVIGVVLALIALGVGLYAGTTGQQSRAMYALVTALALLMSNILMGNGLWNFKRWGLKGAASMHGTLLFYLIAQLVRAIWNPNIPYLDEVLRPPVGLCIIGIALLWIGLFDGGLRVDGQPDPEETRMMLLRTHGPQRAHNVPYQPETPNRYLNRHPGRDDPPWAGIPTWAMMIGAHMLTRLGGKKDGKGGKKQGGIKDVIDLLMKK